MLSPLAYSIRLEAIAVVTLDLQLYDMVFNLWIESEDIQEQFIFWPGERWIVFWTLISLLFVLVTGMLCL